MCVWLRDCVRGTQHRVIAVLCSVRVVSLNPKLSIRSVPHRMRIREGVGWYEPGTF
jgi:hypothetical protein